MADRYDPFPDLARLLDAALRAGRDGAAYAERIAERLGVDPDAGPQAAEEILREALRPAPGQACELVTARCGTPCTEAAVIRLTGTCLHGHVAEREVCEDHQAPEEPLWCRACYRLAEPAAHKCPVSLSPAGAVARTVTPRPEVSRG